MAIEIKKNAAKNISRIPTNIYVLHMLKNEKQMFTDIFFACSE